MQLLRRFGMLILISVTGVWHTNAQNLLKGRVTDPNKEPLISASISIKGTTKGVSTDINGDYSIQIPKGSHTLVAYYLGFITEEIKLTPEILKSGKLDIKLKENSVLLNEVAIIGKSPVQQIRETPFNVTAVEASKLHNTSTDLNQVLNRTTGVRVRESGGVGSDFSFSLNGFSGNQVKFFLDGVPIDNYGSSFTLNNIPVNMAERVEVYKGVVPVHLGGDALGGAVNIVTKQNIRKYIDASYSIGSFGTHKMSLSTRFATKTGFVFNLNAFGNLAKNDYKVSVEPIDKTGTGKFLPEQKFKRFHDGYKSGTLILEGGVKNKAFADYFLIGMTVTGNHDEIQNGINMNRVVGKAFRKSYGFIPNLKYSKKDLFTDGLSLNISSSLNFSTSHSVDTCSRVYNWDGSYGFRAAPDPNAGELGNKTHYVYDETNWVTTTTLAYQINPVNTFAINHTYINYKRKEEDRYKPKELPGEPVVKKNIIGLSYMLKALDNRLNFSAFSKMYQLDSKLNSSTEVVSSSSNNWGYGSALAYQILPVLQAKLSYEYAYRLPAPIELLGDGIYVKSNVDLKPEKSHNLNIGLAYNQQLSSKHFLGIEANFIYRNAKDFIKNKAIGPNTQYTNEDHIRVTGIDGTIRYAFSNWLQFESNATWQETININKFVGNSSVPNSLYGDQMPNTPIFYSNSDLSLSKHSLFQKEDNLTFTMGYNFVSYFYLDWPSLGDKRTKKIIPEQFTQNASLTYSLLNNRYNITLECLNITDQKVYDYYMVQRPGRSFTVKFRYMLNQ